MLNRVEEMEATILQQAKYYKTELDKSKKINKELTYRLNYLYAKQRNDKKINDNIKLENKRQHKISAQRINLLKKTIKKLKTKLKFKDSIEIEVKEESIETEVKEESIEMAVIDESSSWSANLNLNQAKNILSEGKTKFSNLASQLKFSSNSKSLDDKPNLLKRKSKALTENLVSKRSRNRPASISQITEDLITSSAAKPTPFRAKLTAPRDKTSLSPVPMDLTGSSSPVMRRSGRASTQISTIASDNFIKSPLSWAAKIGASPEVQNTVTPAAKSTLKPPVAKPSENTEKTSRENRAKTSRVNLKIKG